MVVLEDQVILVVLGTHQTVVLVILFQVILQEEVVDLDFGEVWDLGVSWGILEAAKTMEEDTGPETHTDLALGALGCPAVPLPQVQAQERPLGTVGHAGDKCH